MRKTQYTFVFCRVRRLYSLQALQLRMGWWRMAWPCIATSESAVTGHPSLSGDTHWDQREFIHDTAVYRLTGDMVIIGKLGYLEINWAIH